jgi:hypothetical protein
MLNFLCNFFFPSFLLCCVVCYSVPVDLRMNLHWSLYEPVTFGTYSEFLDLDGEILKLKKLDSKKGTRSCYEVVRMNESTPFCYPQVLIPGHGKCGTSAMYTYLFNQKDIFTGNIEKENCPKPTYHAFFTSLRRNFNFQGSQIEINGCIHTQEIIIMHRLLQPEMAAYVFMIRNISDYTWAAYNFWCYPEMDNCTTEEGGYTTQNMVRNPEHFHKLIVSPYGRFSCALVRKLYTLEINLLAGVLGKMPLVLSIDALESDVYREKQLIRLKDFLNFELSANLPLETKEFSRVNAGALMNRRGSTYAAENSTVKGVYEVSGFKPMLQQSMDFFKHCWVECEDISAISQFPYNCI